MDYKTLPIDDKTIEQMRITTPDIYNDMVVKYGEECVKNNLLVTYAILQEDKNIITKQNNVIEIDKSTINSIKNKSLLAWKLYKLNPINLLKSYADKELGYSPITLEHREIGEDFNTDDKKGYVLGDSYRTVTVDGKTSLVCDAVLIDPVTKFKYMQGLYRQVSPTIKNGKISALSIVNKPAQLANTSLSEPENITDTIYSIDDEINELQKKIEKEKINNAIAKKNIIAESLTEDLISKGYVNSSEREELTDMFISLSEGDEALLHGALKRFGGGSPILKKSKTVLLQGRYDMKTEDQRFAEFREANPSLNLEDAYATFKKEDVARQQAVSLGEGELKPVNPAKDLHEALLKFKEGKLELPTETQELLNSFCSTSLGDAGKNQSTGGIETPNNTPTSLSSGDAIVEDLQAELHALMITKLELQEKEIALLKRGVK